MPNVKISDAADAGTLLASDMLPLARSGNTNAYHATMTEIAAFASTSLASGAYGNVGRNLIHNPLFNVAQRGAGPWNTGAYTLDRWVLYLSLDAASVSQVSLTDAVRAQIGDESARFCLQNGFTGNAGAAAYTQIGHNIEGVRRLSGKTATVSFWMVASAAGLRVGVNLYQGVGTGGSPSGGGEALATGLPITLTTSWARYSVTIPIPSLTGAVLGTNGDDFTRLQLWLSSGANTSAAAGNIGVQSGTVQLWGVQLEVGSVATPLEKPDPRYDLSNCERFYATAGFFMQLGDASGSIGCTAALPVSMRAIPTIAIANTNGSSNITAPTAGAVSANAAYITASVIVTGLTLLSGTVTASADL